MAERWRPAMSDHHYPPDERVFQLRISRDYHGGGGGAVQYNTATDRTDGRTDRHQQQHGERRR